MAYGRSLSAKIDSKFRRPLAYLRKSNEKIFFGFISLAIVSRVFSDVVMDRWGIHAGLIYPIRHLDGVPLYSDLFLALEWIITTSGAALILSPKFRRLGLALALIGLLASWTQLFQNQKTLMIITILISFVKSPYDNRPAHRLLEWQLILMYLFTALAKLNGEFVTGATLQTLLSDRLPVALPTSAYAALSWTTIALEFLIPVLLLKRNIVVLFAIFILHGLFAVTLDDIWPFTFITYALAILFFDSEDEIKSRDPHQL